MLVRRREDGAEDIEHVEVKDTELIYVYFTYNRTSVNLDD